MLVVVLAAVAVSAKPHEEISKEHAHEVAQECKTETGATDGAYFKLLSTGWLAKNICSSYFRGCGAHDEA